jgi:hypothetical protein
MSYLFKFCYIKFTKLPLSNWLKSENIQPRHLKFSKIVTFVKLQKFKFKSLHFIHQKKKIKII